MLNEYSDNWQIDKKSMKSAEEIDEYILVENRSWEKHYMFLLTKGRLHQRVTMYQRLCALVRNNERSLLDVALSDLKYADEQIRQEGVKALQQMLDEDILDTSFYLRLYVLVIKVMQQVQMVEADQWLNVFQQLISKWTNIEQMMLSEDGEIIVPVTEDLLSQIDQLLEISQPGVAKYIGIKQLGIAYKYLKPYVTRRLLEKTRMFCYDKDSEIRLAVIESILMQVCLDLTPEEVDQLWLDKVIELMYDEDVRIKAKMLHFCLHCHNTLPTQFTQRKLISYISELIYQKHHHIKTVIIKYAALIKVDTTAFIIEAMQKDTQYLQLYLLHNQTSTPPLLTLLWALTIKTQQYHFIIQLLQTHQLSLQLFHKWLIENYKAIDSLSLHLTHWVHHLAINNIPLKEIGEYVLHNLNYQNVLPYLQAFHNHETTLITNQTLPIYTKTLYHWINTGTVPVREQAAQNLLSILKLHSNQTQKTEILNYIQVNHLHSKSYKNRVFYILLAKLIATHFSTNFFINNSMAQVFLLAKDPVSNVRLKLTQIIPQLLSLNDQNIQLQAQQALLLLVHDKDRDVKQQAVAIESEIKSPSICLSQPDENSENERIEEESMLIELEQTSSTSLPTSKEISFVQKHASQTSRVINNKAYQIRQFKEKNPYQLKGMTRHSVILKQSPLTPVTPLSGQIQRRSLKVIEGNDQSFDRGVVRQQQVQTRMESRERLSAISGVNKKNLGTSHTTYRLPKIQYTNRTVLQ